PRRGMPAQAGVGRILLAVALFLRGTAVYAPAARNAFIYDDIQVIQRQRAPRSVADFARIFAERHFYNLPYYRPITRLTLLAQKTVHGDDPAPFHLANAALMGLAAVAAYGLLRRPAFGLERPPAFLAAALFGLHPIASSCVFPFTSCREHHLPYLYTPVAV